MGFVTSSLALITLAGISSGQLLDVLRGKRQSYPPGTFPSSLSTLSSDPELHSDVFFRAPDRHLYEEPQIPDALHERDTRSPSKAVQPQMILAGPILPGPVHERQARKIDQPNELEQRNSAEAQMILSDPVLPGPVRARQAQNVNKLEPRRPTELRRFRRDFFGSMYSGAAGITSAVATTAQGAATTLANQAAAAAKAAQEAAARAAANIQEMAKAALDNVKAFVEKYIVGNIFSTKPENQESNFLTGFRLHVNNLGFKDFKIPGLGYNVVPPNTVVFQFGGATAMVNGSWAVTNQYLWNFMQMLGAFEVGTSGVQLNVNGQIVRSTEGIPQFANGKCNTEIGTLGVNIYGAGLVGAVLNACTWMLGNIAKFVLNKTLCQVLPYLVTAGVNALPPATYPYLFKGLQLEA